MKNFLNKSKCLGSSRFFFFLNCLNCVWYEEHDSQICVIAAVKGESRV